MRHTMSREQLSDLMKDADKRMEGTMKRYLSVPIIRNAVRQPAPGQEDKAGYVVTTTRRSLRS